MNDEELPTCDQLEAGIRAFEANEKRGRVYYEALAQVSAGWGRPAEMAKGAKLLLDSWHQSFYRFGAFSSEKLEQAMAAKSEALSSYRSRSIGTLQEARPRRDQADL